MFAIVTRNKLRGRRYTVNMVWAWSHIRKQLATTPGMLRYTTGIANLTEFYTLALWEREMDMYRFMVSDAHAEMMWNFRKWADSFWSMRFNPCAEEVGAWHQLAFTGRQQVVPPAVDAFAEQVPDVLLQYMPSLKAHSEQPRGHATLDSSAVIGRIATPSPIDVVKLKRLLRPWRDSPQLLRFKLCVGLGECLLLAVWQHPNIEAAYQLMHEVHDRFPDLGVMRFNTTDFEIGHWDNLRLRELDDELSAASTSG